MSHLEMAGVVASVPSPPPGPMARHIPPPSQTTPQCVLEKGCNVGPLQLDDSGSTAMDVAISAGNRKCVEYLLAYELKKPCQHRTAVMKLRMRMSASEMRSSVLDAGQTCMPAGNVDCPCV